MIMADYHEIWLCLHHNLSQENLESRYTKTGIKGGCPSPCTTVIKALSYSMDISAIQWLPMTEICLRTSERESMTPYQIGCGTYYTRDTTLLAHDN